MQVHYMNYANIVDGSYFRLDLEEVKINNTSPISSILNNMNKVYTNGACEIYEKNS